MFILLARITFMQILACGEALVPGVSVRRHNSLALGLNAAGPTLSSCPTTSGPPFVGRQRLGTKPNRFRPVSSPTWSTAGST